MDRDISQNLAVDLNLGTTQAIDQAAVRQAMQASGRIDTRDPQSAKLTFTSLSATCSVEPNWRLRLDFFLVRM